MADLFSQNIGTNYRGILNLGPTINTDVSTALQPITDGRGSNSALSISTKSISVNNKINIGNSAEEPAIFNDNKDNINISVNTNTIVVSNRYSTGSYDSGATPPDNAPSAIFEMASTTQGMLLPRMSRANMKTNITSPTAGLVVYTTDGDGSICYYNGTNWFELNATIISS
jgi:hypothetical protein